MSLESLIDAVPLLEVVNIHKEDFLLAVQCNSCGGRRSARILTLLVRLLRFVRGAGELRAVRGDERACCLRIVRQEDVLVSALTEELLALDSDDLL